MNTTPNQTQRIVSGACALVTTSKITAEDPLIHTIARVTARLALDAVARQYPHLSHRDHVAIATRHLLMAPPTQTTGPAPRIFRSRN